MMNYATYEFYEEEFKGNLSDDLFSSLIIKASRIIDNNVNCRLTEELISSMSEDDKYKIKYTACELVDYLNSNSLDGDGGVGSISIDGVSINKNVMTDVQLANKKREIISCLPHEIIRYL